jgi:hypothetical protein
MRICLDTRNWRCDYLIGEIMIRLEREWTLHSIVTDSLIQGLGRTIHSRSALLLRTCVLPSSSLPGSEQGEQTQDNDECDDEHFEVAQERVAVPDLNPTEAELDALRQRLNEEAEQRSGQRRQHCITNPPSRATPLSEFNNAQKILSLAIPTLYPYGQADFLKPTSSIDRFRSIL